MCLLAQGHHLVEVTAREAGDDHTMDPKPVAIDFFVGYEAPFLAAIFLRRQRKGSSAAG